MNSQIDPCRLAQSIPMGFERLVAVGPTSLRQEERVAIIELLQATAASIKHFPVYVGILTQHLRCLWREANSFHASSTASFTESQSLLVATAFPPIADGQLHQFTNACACFVGHPHDNPISQVELGNFKMVDKMLMQVRFIDRGRNPGLSGESEVVIRRKAILRNLYATYLWHSWSLAGRSTLLCDDFLEQ